MDGLPSSTDAQEESDYESLEEYQMATQRDKDSEVRKSIRPWTWMEAQMYKITRNIGTNQAEVANRAFSMGLKIVRNDIGDDVDEVADMVDAFLDALGEIHTEAEGVEEVHTKFFTFKIELQKDHGEVGDTKKYPIKDSELAEAKSAFTEHGFLGGWIYRVIIAMGLEKSELLDGFTEEKLDELNEDLNVTVEGTREELEAEIKNFLGNNIGLWLREGISKDSYQRLEEAVGHMDTRHKKDVQEVMDHLDKFKRTEEE